MNRFLLNLLVLLVASSATLGQQKCGHIPYLDYLETISPGINKAIENSFLDAVQESSQKSKTAIGGLYQVQVVFHVVYNSEEQNVSDSVILEQLALLNSCFRRTTADTSDTRDVFKPVADDTQIEFVLAQQDPDGNPSSGIVRKRTNREDFGSVSLDLDELDKVKQLPDGSKAWDTDKYLNIWICDLSANGFDFLFGYAFPPIGAPYWDNLADEIPSNRQGVVVHYPTVGGLVTSAAIESGSKTLVHEVGHYLGLRHIWGDGGCGQDDFIKDTPEASEESFSCDFNKNTCSPFGQVDQPDMLENYMDYSPDVCLNMFTAEQAELMRVNLRRYRSDVFVDTSGRFMKRMPPVALAVSLSPNPAYSEAILRINGLNKTSMYAIRIVNALGQQCYSANLLSVREQRITGLSTLRGAYSYEVLEDDKRIASGKLFITN